jgi:hypothetical protein
MLAKFKEKMGELEEEVKGRVRALNDTDTANRQAAADAAAASSPGTGGESAGGASGSGARTAAAAAPTPGTPGKAMSDVPRAELESTCVRQAAQIKKMDTRYKEVVKMYRATLAEVKTLKAAAGYVCLDRE